MGNEIDSKVYMGNVIDLAARNTTFRKQLLANPKTAIDRNAKRLGFNSRSLNRADLSRLKRLTPVELSALGQIKRKVGAVSDVNGGVIF